jgi:Kef-type K+ transport system membrane component KefB
MTPTNVQAIHFLIALSALLIAAHAGRLAFALLRQPPALGELVAGLVLGPTLLGEISPSAERWLGAFTRTASTFFVPIYLAMVGLRLDLVRQVDWWFLCWFLAVACVAKSASVWLGARAAGTPRRLAIDLAIATNARGGPGILIASTTYAAGIVSAKLFTALILLSLVTSQAAGAWLGRAVRTGRLPTASSLRVRRAEESMATPVAAGPPAAQS